VLVASVKSHRLAEKARADADSNPVFHHQPPCLNSRLSRNQCPRHS
jgi:hypothetical protein